MKEERYITLADLEFFSNYSIKMIHRSIVSFYSEQYVSRIIKSLPILKKQVNFEQLSIIERFEKAVMLRNLGEE